MMSFFCMFLCWIAGSYNGGQQHTVPVLCYHQVRDWAKTDSKSARAYIVPPADFRAQIKTLKDSGYHTMLPDELIDFIRDRKSVV